MADFHLWQKATLVHFAEAATEKLDKQDKQIAQLQADLKTMQLAWREALRKSASTATVSE